MYELLNVRPEDINCSSQYAMQHTHLKRARLACWLYKLQGNNGEVFAAGTVFEVLRDNNDGTVNLCEVDLTHPFRVGRTITKVNV